MMIRAYSEDYLWYAQRILGDMLDFAVNTYELDENEFWEMFLVSDASEQFQIGNPSYVSGKTGCELVKEVIRTSGRKLPEFPDEMYPDKSPEYWAGWALAYYQWYTAKTFMRIYRAVSMTEILKMYPVFHEMDIMQFVDAMNKKMKDFYVETNLKRIRTQAGLSQRELADSAGISVRQIQLFEQRQRNINHTQAISLWKLSRILGCKSEDLLEI